MRYTVKHFNTRGRYLDARPAVTDADMLDVVAELTKANPKNHRFEVWTTVLGGVCLSAVYRNGEKVTP
jgi:hypothetical protein